MTKLTLLYKTLPDFSFIDFHVFKKGTHADSCIIDENINPAKSFDGRIDKAQAILFVAYITSDGMQRLIGIFELKTVELIEISGTGSDAGALGKQGFNHRFANTFAAPR